VMFAVLLVVANTMSMAVRERRREIGVLKTLGFSDQGVMALVAAEAVLIGAAAGALGIALSGAAVSGLSALPFLGDAVRAYPDLSLSPSLAAAGLAAALSVSGLAGIVPALLAFRIRVAEALRTI